MFEFTVCPDCALWIANRDSSGSSDEWFAAIASDPTILETLALMVVTANEDSDWIVFSSAPCSGCGTRLAGSRCPVEMLEHVHARRTATDTHGNPRGSYCATCGDTIPTVTVFRWTPDGIEIAWTGTLDQDTAPLYFLDTLRAFLATAEVGARVPLNSWHFAERTA